MTSVHLQEKQTGGVLGRLTGLDVNVPQTRCVLEAETLQGGVGVEGLRESTGKCLGCLFAYSRGKIQL